MTNKSKGKEIQDIIMKECGRKPQACITLFGRNNEGGVAGDGGAVWKDDGR